MLQSMGSQRVRHDLATEQQQPNPKQISIADTHKKRQKGIQTLKTVEDRGNWDVAIHGITESDTTWPLNNSNNFLHCF